MWWSGNVKLCFGVCGGVSGVNCGVVTLNV